jgi:hypothetical protein
MLLKTQCRTDALSKICVCVLHLLIRRWIAGWFWLPGFFVAFHIPAFAAPWVLIWVLRSPFSNDVINEYLDFWVCQLKNCITLKSVVYLCARYYSLCKMLPIKFINIDGMLYCVNYCVKEFYLILKNELEKCCE